MAVQGGLLFFEVDDQDVLVAISALAAATSGPSLSAFLSTAMTSWLQRRASERFANEGDDAAGMWEPLTIYTERWRESQGFPPAHPINRRTGEMERYVTSAGGTVTVFGSGSGASLLWPDTPGGELGDKVRTAQKGKDDPYTPARPVAAVSMTDLQFALTALQRWIISAVQNPSAAWI